MFSPAGQLGSRCSAGAGTGVGGEDGRCGPRVGALSSGGLALWVEAMESQMPTFYAVGSDVTLGT